MTKNSIIWNRLHPEKMKEAQNRFGVKATIRQYGDHVPYLDVQSRKQIRILYNLGMVGTKW